MPSYTVVPLPMIRTYIIHHLATATVCVCANIRSIHKYIFYLLYIASPTTISVALLKAVH